MEDHAPSGRAWRETLSVAWLTLRGVRDDALTDGAAALTYYSVLAVFPALAVLASLLGLLGSDATVNSLLTAIDKVAPASVSDTLDEPIGGLVNNKGAGAIALAVGTAISLFSASGYVGAFSRASHRMREDDASDPIWRARPIQMLAALVIVLLVALALVTLLITGPMARALAEAIGVSSGAGDTFQLVKWPILVVAGLAMLVVLYSAAIPGRRGRALSLVPGALLAIALWGLGSFGFSAYVSNLSDYSLTYGALAGAVVFLVWLWLGNLAVLLGAKLNAVLAEEPGLG